MSYTTNRQPQGILKNIETFFREGMIAELVAINDYSSFISLTDNKEVNDIFHHIMEEEKKHYGLFLQALRSVDKEQAELKAKVDEQLDISSKEKYKEYIGKGSKHNLLSYIRDAIKGELEAIILYEYFIENLENEKAIELIKEIIKEEKEHIEELTKALVILDKDKYNNL
ncbi:ferritin family protein [uncultured Clostridium sp.]|uniref:ferritin family protein n=1 Tax=uncultured Clostridium sp. TaxID=59620 RepID=UPI0028E97B1C|nr:ferritin family protein [uncultured Clostridium sp.]